MMAITLQILRMIVSDINCKQFLCLASCYSVINKNGTIRSNYINFKDPSLNGNGSPSLTYADIGGSLRRGVDSPRRFGSVSGSINDEVGLVITLYNLRAWFTIIVVLGAIRAIHRHGYSSSSHSSALLYNLRR